jgi:hypothetical protein
MTDKLDPKKPPAKLPGNDFKYSAMRRQYKVICLRLILPLGLVEVLNAPQSSVAVPTALIE